jgi:hypothetical protein
MRAPVLAGLLVAALVGVLLVLKRGPSETELDRVYRLAMSGTMQSPGELAWASALLRAHGRVGQANMVDLKVAAIRAAPVPVSLPAGFVPGHHYSGRVQLSGLEAAFAGVSDASRGVEQAIGMPVQVESLGSGAYLVSGIWSGVATPYPVPLPDRVEWIRDDTTGEVVR